MTLARANVERTTVRSAEGTTVRSTLRVILPGEDGPERKTGGRLHSLSTVRVKPSSRTRDSDVGAIELARDRGESVRGARAEKVKARG